MGTTSAAPKQTKTRNADGPLLKLLH